MRSAHNLLPKDVGPKVPQVVILFGATGDLSQRKLIPGLFRLATQGFIPQCFIVGTALEDITRDEFIKLARNSVDSFYDHPFADEDWDSFAEHIDFVSAQSGPAALREAVETVQERCDRDLERLHYLSVPPKAAMASIKTIAEAGLVEHSRVIMEKPFGTDLESAINLNKEIHKVFDEEQVFRIDHFLGKEPAQNILAFRFANGLFEPIWNRNFIDHIQIDVPETLEVAGRADFYEATGAYRDMVVTHLFQIMAFVAMEAPTALAPGPISEEKNKVFRSMVPIQPDDVVRGQYGEYRDIPGVDFESDTETFIALRCAIDNWRWAGVPFYLRTGKGLGEGQRIVSIAFREPPKSMFPEGSGVGTQGPDHLTFDLADAAKVSLSFYGKRPGPGMRLDKLSMQFSMDETGMQRDVLEAYERLILDAMLGDHTLFTTAEGIERLWEVSEPLLQSPPPTRPYAIGSWGPNAIHQLVAPNAWRLPFEREWREPLDEVFDSR